MFRRTADRGVGWWLACLGAIVWARAGHAQSLMWYNSVYLVGAISPDVHGYGGRTWAPPLSDRGARVLDELARRGLTPEVLFEHPRLMASVVLAGIEGRAPIIPTEEYFYYEIMFDGVWIAGNLRTTDASRGVLHCGYYLRDEPRRSRYAALTAVDGICVSETVMPGGREVHVVDEQTGAGVTFEVRDAAELPFGNSTPRLAGEEVITPVIDESGVAFLLVFDRGACALGYVLAAAPGGDELLPLDEPGTWKGCSSGFVYVEDSLGRPVLAGVNRTDVAMNTFYDGPFDQVPPRLPIREVLRWAYPGLEDRRGDTLDAHGNWEAQAGTRVAIAPYVEYEPGGEGRCVMWARRAEWMRHADMEPTPPEVRADSSWIGRFAEVVRAHAREWPPEHLLRVSAEAVTGLER